MLLVGDLVGKTHCRYDGVFDTEDWPAVFAAGAQVTGNAC